MVVFRVIIWCFGVSGKDSLDAVVVRGKVVAEIVKRLKREMEFYEEVDRKFRRKYGCSLEDLELKIEREGIPVDNHEVWEDSIEWRNAIEEVDKLRKILEELQVAIKR